MNTAELIQLVVDFIENQGLVVISCVAFHDIEH